MPKYKLPKISTDDLTLEEQKDLQDFIKYREKNGYSTRLLGQQEAYLVGFAYAISSLTRKIGQTLHENATEFEKLGNQFK